MLWITIIIIILKFRSLITTKSPFVHVDGGHGVFCLRSFICMYACLYVSYICFSVSVFCVICFVWLRKSTVKWINSRSFASHARLLLRNYREKFLFLFVSVCVCVF